MEVGNLDARRCRGDIFISRLRRDPSPPSSCTSGVRQGLEISVATDLELFSQLFLKRVIYEVGFKGNVYLGARRVCLCVRIVFPPKKQVRVRNWRGFRKWLWCSKYLTHNLLAVQNSSWFRLKPCAWCSYTSWPSTDLISPPTHNIQFAHHSVSWPNFNYYLTRTYYKLQCK